MVILPRKSIEKHTTQFVRIQTHSIQRVRYTITVSWQHKPWERSSACWTENHFARRILKKHKRSENCTNVTLQTGLSAAGLALTGRTETNLKHTDYVQKMCALASAIQICGYRLWLLVVPKGAQKQNTEPSQRPKTTKQARKLDETRTAAPARLSGRWTILCDSLCLSVLMTIMICRTPQRPWQKTSHLSRIIISQKRRNVISNM